MDFILNFHVMLLIFIHEMLSLEKQKKQIVKPQMKKKRKKKRYEEDFDTDQLLRVIKISGLSTKMYIYTQYKSPLLLKSNIGSLGMIHIYIKTVKKK